VFSKKKKTNGLFSKERDQKKWRDVVTPLPRGSSLTNSLRSGQNNDTKMFCHIKLGGGEYGGRPNFLPFWKSEEKKSTLLVGRGTKKRGSSSAKKSRNQLKKQIIGKLGNCDQRIRPKGGGKQVGAQEKNVLPQQGPCEYGFGGGAGGGGAGSENHRGKGEVCAGGGGETRRNVGFRKSKRKTTWVTIGHLPEKTAFYAGGGNTEKNSFAAKKGKKINGFSTFNETRDLVTKSV